MICMLGLGLAWLSSSLKPPNRKCSQLPSSCPSSFSYPSFSSCPPQLVKTCCLGTAPLRSGSFFLSFFLCLPFSSWPWKSRGSLFARLLKLLVLTLSSSYGILVQLAIPQGQSFNVPGLRGAQTSPASSPWSDPWHRFSRQCLGNQGTASAGIGTRAPPAPMASILRAKPRFITSHIAEGINS